MSSATVPVAEPHGAADVAVGEEPHQPPGRVTGDAAEHVLRDRRDASANVALAAQRGFVRRRGAGPPRAAVSLRPMAPLGCTSA
jgi:hypothetical protein